MAQLISKDSADAKIAKVSSTTFVGQLSKLNDCPDGETCLCKSNVGIMQTAGSFNSK